MSTLRTSGLDTMSFPVECPYPGSTDRTPGGTDVCSVNDRTRTECSYNTHDLPLLSAPQIQGLLQEQAKSPSRVSTISCKNVGHCTSEGFTITLFPAARAGAIFLIAIKRG
jgi:hypothetical protein